MREFFPIMLCGCEIGARRTTFYPHGKPVGVDMPRKLALLIVHLDGTASYETVVEEFGRTWDKAWIERVLTHLIAQDIIWDSHNLSAFTLQFGMNPNPWCTDMTDEQSLALAQDQSLHSPPTPVDAEFVVPVTPWMQLMEQRKSTRNFAGIPTSLQTLLRLLWACYGMTNHPASANGLHSRTVPSAGGLYPLIVHLVIPRPIAMLPHGVYRVTSTAENTLSFRRLANDATMTLWSFAQQQVVGDAAGVIVISGSFERSTSKYANRGISYTLLEAGHAAQNIHLAALAERIATLEIGDFMESDLRDALQLGRSQLPLIAVAFGIERTDG